MYGGCARIARGSVQITPAFIRSLVNNRKEGLQYGYRHSPHLYSGDTRNSLWSPRHGRDQFPGPKKPTPEKLAPYECGIQEIEAPKRRFPVKYLLTGMLFIVFDIEIVSFYPMAILLRSNLKVLGLVEMLIFLLILAVGYIYVWRKGAFTWE